MVEKDCGTCIHHKRMDAVDIDDLEICATCFNSDYEKPDQQDKQEN